MTRLEEWLSKNTATVMLIWFPALAVLALLTACGPEVAR